MPTKPNQTTTMKINIREITSISIRAAAQRAGLTTIELIGDNGASGDHKLTAYRIGNSRVIETNGNPIWEENNPSDFIRCLADIESDAMEPVLYNYTTGEPIRPALLRELEASRAAGPEGVITVDIDGEEVSCYVTE